MQCHIEAREDNKRLPISRGNAESGSAFLPLSEQPFLVDERTTRVRRTGKRKHLIVHLLSCAHRRHIVHKGHFNTGSLVKVESGNDHIKRLGLARSFDHCAAVVESKGDELLRAAE